MILNKTEDHSGGKRENLKIKFLNDESLHNSGNNVHGWLAHDDAFQNQNSETSSKPVTDRQSVSRGRRDNLRFFKSDVET